MDNQNGARQPFAPITPPSWGAMACKRAFDIVCSLLGLVVLSPLLPVVSLLVAVTSPGGVFFRQERIGKGGKSFRIFKFRSMRKDNAGLKITTGNDSRITPVGRFLRKSKIDELPQLINVLVGDMSFVGPRPEVADYVLCTPPISARCCWCGPASRAWRPSASAMKTTCSPPAPIPTAPISSRSCPGRSTWTWSIFPTPRCFMTSS